MENEILENGTTPETEEVQETVEVTETVEATETAAEVQATDKKVDNKITAFLAMAADKGKELVASPKTLIDKIKAVPKKIWIIAGTAIAALIAIVIVISLLGNTYKTPINAAEKLLNSKSVNQVLNRAPALLNGFGEDEAKTLISIVKKSDTYKDNVEDIEDAFDSVIEMLEDNVGSNYKIKLKVTDKEKLEKDDLKAFRNQLRGIGEMGEMLEEMDSDDIGDLADDTGLSKSQVKKAIKALESFCDDCDSAKVKKGYELTVEVKITGNELDEPMEMEIPVNVFKVAGRWVPDVFSLADSVMGGMGDIGSLIGMMGGMNDIGGLLGGF